MWWLFVWQCTALHHASCHLKDGYRNSVDLSIHCWQPVSMKCYFGIENSRHFRCQSSFQHRRWRQDWTNKHGKGGVRCLDVLVARASLTHQSHSVNSPVPLRPECKVNPGLRWCCDIWWLEQQTNRSSNNNNKQTVGASECQSCYNLNSTNQHHQRQSRE